VDLVDEQHVAGLEIREQRGEVARTLDRGPARRAQRRTELVGDRARERRLAEPGRSVEQDMVERLAARARRADEHGQVLAQAVLADHLGQRARAQAFFEQRLFRQRAPGEVAARGVDLDHRASPRSAARTQLSTSASSPTFSAARSSARSACWRG
jgi:hypothetical protein